MNGDVTGWYPECMHQMGMRQLVPNNLLKYYSLMYHRTTLDVVYVYNALLCIYTAIMSILYTYCTIYTHHFSSGVCLLEDCVCVCMHVRGLVHGCVTSWYTKYVLTPSGNVRDLLLSKGKTSLPTRSTLRN